MPTRHFADFLERLESRYTMDTDEAAGGPPECPARDDVTAADLSLEGERECADAEEVATSADAMETHSEAEEDDESWEEPGWFSYVSSHPPSRERIARFRAAGGQ